MVKKPPTRPVANGDPGDEQPSRPPTPEEIALSYVEQRLYALGFTVEQCAALAESHADWHEAERMLDNGAPHHLVVQILL